MASRAEDRPWRRDPLALLVAAVAVAWMVLAIGSPLTGGTTFHSTQLLDSFAFRQAAAPNGTVPSNTCTSDTVDVFLPGRVAAPTRWVLGGPRRTTPTTRAGRAAPSSGSPAFTTR